VVPSYKLTGWFKYEHPVNTKEYFRLTHIRVAVHIKIRFQCLIGLKKDTAKLNKGDLGLAVEMGHVNVWKSQVLLFHSTFQMQSSRITDYALSAWFYCLNNQHDPILLFFITWFYNK
jgi:hypothetical protein